MRVAYRLYAIDKPDLSTFRRFMDTSWRYVHGIDRLYGGRASLGTGSHRIAT